MERKSIQELIDGLGDTREIIRHSLWWGGYMGCQYSPENCVVSAYLDDHGANGTAVVTREKATAIMAGDGESECVLRPYQHEFLHHFDHGRYPELLWKQHKVR